MNELAKAFKNPDLFKQDGITIGKYHISFRTCMRELPEIPELLPEIYKDQELIVKGYKKDESDEQMNALITCLRMDTWRCLKDLVKERKLVIPILVEFPDIEKEQYQIKFYPNKIILDDVDLYSIDRYVQDSVEKITEIVESSVKLFDHDGYYFLLIISFVDELSEPLSEAEFQEAYRFIFRFLEEFNTFAEKKIKKAKKRKKIWE